MSEFLELTENLKKSVQSLNEILVGDENAIVNIDGVEKPSLEKKVFDTLNSLIQLVIDQISNIDGTAFRSVEIGLSSTTSGQHFSVISDNEENFLDLYENESGNAIFIKSYPSYEGINQRFNLSVEEDSLLNLVDKNNNTIFRINTDGSVYLPKLKQSLQEKLTELESLPNDIDSTIFKLTDKDGKVVLAVNSLGDLLLANHDGKSLQQITSFNVSGDLLRLKDELEQVYLRIDQSGGLFLAGLDKSVQEYLNPPIKDSTILYVNHGPTVLVGELHPSPASQRVPGAAITGNRSWACWYSNDEELIGEEGPGDYVNIAYSDDNWETNKEYAVIRFDQPGDEDKRVFDPQMWVDKSGLLWIIFSVAGNNQKFDGLFGVWAVTIKNPEAAFPHFSTPFRLSEFGIGMLPQFINEQIYIPIDYWRMSPLYPEEAGKRVHIIKPEDRTSHYLSTLPEGVQSSSFDETYIVQLSTGRLLAAYRTAGKTERCFSDDDGKTWTAPEIWDALGSNTSSRIWMGHTPSGRLLVCYNNSNSRNNLQLKLSEDDGESFPYNIQISNVSSVSYPSVYFDGLGNICVVYDQNRTTEKIINVGIVNEQEIISGNAAVITRNISDK